MTDSKALLVDIGSTYTKVAAVCLTDARIITRGKSVTTIETDVTDGLQKALVAAGIDPPALPAFAHLLACSSAAGRLSLVAIGLVPQLTAEAARRAALGAGAVVRKVLSHRLTAQEIVELEAVAPDIVLLAGGTDGGERATILHNAVMLAGSNLRVPIIVAGNKEAAGQALDILRRQGKDARLAENVMPQLNDINVEPAQQAIRRVFLERIVEAKGLRRAEEMLDGVAMPTPSAVLAAARLLADGTGGVEGWGELIVVDVGGATTDVHSVAEGTPRRSDVICRGLPEPRLKRTVEGDLGLRASAPSLLAALTPRRVAKRLGSNDRRDSAASARKLSLELGYVPGDPGERAFEEVLAHGAVEIAVSRHAGRLEELLLPNGRRYLQRGKDLTAVGTVIATGGVFAHHPGALAILRGALNENDVFSLAPRNARLCLDRHYILWAAGLLSEESPSVALELMKRYLTKES